MYAAVACLVAGAEAFGYKGVTVATEPPAAAPTALAAYLAPCDDAVVVSDWAELEAAVAANETCVEVSNDIAFYGQIVVATGRELTVYSAASAGSSLLGNTSGPVVFEDIGGYGTRAPASRAWQRLREGRARGQPVSSLVSSAL